MIMSLMVLTQLNISLESGNANTDYLLGEVSPSNSRL
jgi:hypothetical protein